MSNNSNNKLHNMMSNATSSQDDSHLNTQVQDKKSKRTKIYIGIGTALILSMIAGGIICMPHFMNKQHNNIKVENNDVKKHNSKNLDNAGQVPFAQEPTPVNLDKWQKIPFSSQDVNNKPSKDLSNKLMEWANKSPQLHNAMNAGFVSGGNGYTDTEKNSTLSNGKINTKYSFLTADNIKLNYAEFINRLINPMFGDWQFAQFSQFDPKSFTNFDEMRNMFTNKWWSNNIKEGKDYSALPVLADWNKDDYGGIKFANNQRARWYGKLVRQSVSPSSNDDGSFKQIKVVNSVKYSAYDENQNVITKHGTLTLILVMNHTNEVNPHYRVLIDYAKLDMQK